MSKPNIFLILAMYEGYLKSNIKVKKIASACKNLVLCPGLISHMLLIGVFRVARVAYRL